MPTVAFDLFNRAREATAHVVSACMWLGELTVTLSDQTIMRDPNFASRLSRSSLPGDNGRDKTLGTRLKT